mmetsp:Transcript_78917/g.231641  ORF Transcript_78917/g.231641 Transcript_78917/m.231641 type:complete len:485 (-) Transcript_78917:70-1524(-)
MPHTIDRRCHRCDDAITDVGLLREPEDLLLLIVGYLHKVDIAFTVHMHSLNEGPVNWEACACVCGRIMPAPVNAREMQLITRADGVNHIAGKDHLLGAWHLARLNRARGLLKCDLLEVLVKRLLAVHLPRALGLALNTRAWLQVLILSHIKGAAREIALCAAQVQPLHFIEHIGTFSDNSVNVDELAHVLCAQLPDGLTDREAMDRNSQLILLRLLQLLVSPEFGTCLLQKSLVQNGQDAHWILCDPQCQFCTPLIDVRETNIQVPLVLLCHLTQHVRILWLCLPLGCELLQELLEIPPDLLVKSLLDTPAFRQLLSRQVVISFWQVFIMCLSLCLLGEALSVAQEVAKVCSTASLSAASGVPPKVLHVAGRERTGWCQGKPWCSRRAWDAWGHGLAALASAALASVAVSHGPLCRPSLLHSQNLLLCVVKHGRVVAIILWLILVVAVHVLPKQILALLLLLAVCDLITQQVLLVVMGGCHLRC